jgi:hypothetical protein
VAASETSPVELAPAAAGAAVGAAIARAPIGTPPGGSETTAAHRAPASIPAARVMADTQVDAPAAGSRVLGPASHGRSWLGAGRAPVAIGLAVLALAVVVGGVGAYVFLPTATAVIAPRQGTIGPIELRIVADPSLTAPDAEARTVPAVTKPVPVETTQTFEVTGKRVVEVKAKGSVRFRNFDSDEANTIPRGSIVGTRGGIHFRTDREVTIPRAEQVLFQIFPASATVTITAVEGGPDGNVGKNQIRLIPAGEDPQTTDVINLEATSGGKRDEFPRVVEKDIEAATTALQAALDERFTAAVADPALSADGTTVFPDTADLGAVSYTVDPASLLDQEVETFELGARATGTVLAVDESAVQQVAEANIEPQVEQGYALVDGSSQVDPLPGMVEEGVISFPVTITAQQVLQVDPDAIEAEIRGKSLADAQAILDGYGQAQLSVWPDWVGTIPTLDARVDVRMAVDVDR